MSSTTPNPYLRTQVMTAGPMQLRMLLFDGGLKFARQGRAGLAEEDFEKSYTNLSKAQNVVLELANGLDHSQAPDLCSRLEALYNFMYRRLVEANMQRDPAVVDEVIDLLEYERETWRQLMEQVEQPEQSAASPDGDGEAKPAQPASAPTPASPYAPQSPQGPVSTLSKSA
jgi:flagellar protein FliS